MKRSHAQKSNNSVACSLHIITVSMQLNLKLKHMVKNNLLQGNIVHSSHKQQRYAVMNAKLLHNNLLTTASNLMSCIESPETHSSAVFKNIIVDEITRSSPSTYAKTLALNLRQCAAITTLLVMSALQ